MSKVIILQNYMILYLSPGKTRHINPVLPTLLAWEGASHRKVSAGRAVQEEGPGGSKSLEVGIS